MPVRQFQDKLILDGVTRTKDGFMTASVKAARTGIQIYTGAEVGMPDLATVRVYRPETEVFNKDSLHSYAWKPVTINHPTEDVTAKNWKDLARGYTGDEVARDGDFVRVPLALMDAAAIQAVEDGKREVSMGYSAILEFVDGITPSGEPFNAVQRELRMNHLAIVSAARGGSDLRVGDGEREPNMANKIVLVDGLQVETTEAGAQAIEKLMRDLKAVRDQGVVDLAAKDTQITTLKAEVSKKDGEMAVMKKQIDDGAMTPAKLDAAVLSRSALITDAKKIAGDNLVVKDRTDAEIRRAAIAAHLGDEEAKKMDDAAISGAFAFAAKAAGGTGPVNNGLQPLRQAIAGSQSVNDAAEADKAWNDHVAGLQTAYKSPSKVAA